MHKHVLIAGIAGSGKTYLSKYFKKMGKNAYDADEIDSLGKWVDKKGNRSKYIQEEVDEKWLSTHFWNWDVTKIKELLRENQDRELFLFGNASNLDKFVGLFDKVYYLKATDGTIMDRLDHPTRINPFGKSDPQKKMILKWMRHEEQLAKEKGFEIIDASRPPKQILNIITA